MDRLLERPLIEGAGAMDLKIPPLLQARTTKVTPFLSSGVREAAARAIGGMYGSDCLLTIRTNDEVFHLAGESVLTDGTNRGKDEVQKPSAWSGGPHLKIPGH
jgi:hypothetical protein